MTCEQAARPILVLACFGLAQEQFLQCHCRLQVVAGALHVNHPVFVGLEFVLPAVLGLQQLCAEHRALAHHLAKVGPAVRRRGNRGDRGADLHQLSFLELLRAVPCGGVHDLV